MNKLYCHYSQRLMFPNDELISAKIAMKSTATSISTSFQLDNSPIRFLFFYGNINVSNVSRLYVCVVIFIYLPELNSYIIKT